MKYSIVAITIKIPSPDIWPVHKVRDEKYLVRLARNLKKARKLRGISQEDLADKSGLALSQIARIETGKLNSTYSTLVVILKALNAKADELFE